VLSECYDVIHQAVLVGTRKPAAYGCAILLIFNSEHFTDMASTRQITRELEGTRTEVVLQSFSDRILVLVTQMGKVGTLVAGGAFPSRLLLTNIAPKDTSNDTFHHTTSPCTCAWSFSAQCRTSAVTASCDPTDATLGQRSFRAHANFALPLRFANVHNIMDCRI
jgi:hypothetical protein